MNTPPPSADRLPLIGACFGALAWLFYGALELCCMAILPKLMQPAYDYKACDAPFSLLVILVYAAGGAAVGFLSGVVLRRISGLGNDDRVRGLRALATILLSTVLLLNVAILWNSSPYSPILLAVNLIFVIAASLCSAGRGKLARQCDPFAASWLPSASYLAAQWVAVWFGNGGSGRSSVYASLSIAFLWVAAWLIGKAANRGAGAFPARALAGVSVFTLLCCALTAAFRPAVYTASGPARPPAAGKPNVILISLDTVRADHLSVYGYGRNTTPHLKDFAAESVVFTHAVASSDMTLPTHASMFTGLYPSQHGAHFSREHRIGAPLQSRFVTLAESLHRNGFWTGGVVANGGYLSVAFGLQAGFEYWDQRLPRVLLTPAPESFLRGRVRDIAARLLPVSELDRVTRGGREINDAAFAALSQRPGDGRPFFLFLNYMDAHVPYIPPAPYDTMFPGKDPAFTENRYMSTYLDVIAHDRKISDSAHRHLVSQYDGGIAYLDAQLAVLFERLKAAGLYDNTLIIVTGDHGEALGERNCMDHGGMSLYEEQIHVPLIIKFPNSRRAATVSAPVSSVDILPTVLDVAGVPNPANVAGVSLNAPVPEGREVISESFPGGRAFFTNATRFDRMYRSVVSSSLKFIAPSAGKPELYDLRHDPAEATNLYNPDEAQSRAVSERLIAWSRTMRGGAQGPVKIDRETMERLRSLGYVQ
jgi:arylsulfatase A-like enzyme